MKDNFPERLNRRFSAFTEKMGLFSGLLFLLLSFFMAFETTSRHFGGPYTGFSDQIASLVMALGGTWSLSHALALDSHVYIDVLSAQYPKKVNALCRVLALITVGFMAVVLAFQAFNLAWASYEIGALVPQSMIDFPLALPQALTGVGFSMFAIQAFLMMLVGLVNLPEAGRAVHEVES
ncbi:MAG: TRAP transporter small permease [Alcaligenaceae bacterium]|nr:TRAP transporter small permease [Alcaligenaceae bacterium]